ncbi:MAG: HAMP domain-containing histidine kinase [Verrucomicrobia bacterium]|nr:HAMP domain-containing histidine kinase [Verrucomicrobiota bacterium]
MERIVNIQKLLLRSKRLPWLVLLTTLLILAGVIALTMQQTRSRIRAQIAGRDAEILHAVARMQMPMNAAADAVEDADEPENLLTVILQTSKLSGVMGARLFNADGKFVESFPVEMFEAEISEDDLTTMDASMPIGRFWPAYSLDVIFLPGASTEASERRVMPILEVIVPLEMGRESRLVGIAQFIIEGHSIAAEFARLDRHLARQALTAFLVGGFVLAVTIIWSFRRLNQAHQMLAERTENLLKANQELALAAKTSAVGAVTSHLIHGLRNPLAGLQNFVAGLGASVADNPDTDLQQAIASTRRMQAMINEVVTVLREDDGSGQYELPVAELVEMISGRVRSMGRERGVDIFSKAESGAVLPNRVANLVVLILVNLVQNAIEVTPKGRRVTLALREANETLWCEVRDEGPGFPANRTPFVPCSSAKEGGSGIGLAISKQLANHLGASLELNTSSNSGCVFVLSLPASLWKTKTHSMTVTLG